VRVHINAGGREVTIECSDANVTTKDVAAEALAVWTATNGAQCPSDGPASAGLTLGFGATRDPSSTIRRHPGVPE
jgi:hypothetical protein